MSLRALSPQKLSRERRRMRAHARLLCDCSAFTVRDAAQSYASWRATLGRGQGERERAQRMGGYFKSTFGVDWRDAVRGSA